MKLTLILCTFVIVFNGTIKFFVQEEVRPAMKHYAEEFSQWL